MMLLKKGSKGEDVFFAQIYLNIQVKPIPKLNTDKVFDTKTEETVLFFQKIKGLTQDGIIGPRTWEALNNFDNIEFTTIGLSKFSRQLGNFRNFINYVKKVETDHKTYDQVMNDRRIWQFVNTKNTRRYLITKRGGITNGPTIIDFRHFFAAASESYIARFSRNKGYPIGGNRGSAVLLGLGNEFKQCIDEIIAKRINSCFSKEDLTSNRLGAEFGKLLKIAKSMNSKRSVSDNLNVFLLRYQPVYFEEELRGKINEMPSGKYTAIEALAAVALWFYDLLIPDTY